MSYTIQTVNISWGPTLRSAPASVPLPRRHSSGVKAKVMLYDCTGAGYSGVTNHAQQEMKRYGITYFHATPQSIADCWWFWLCENVPENLPPWIYEITLDPMEQVGYGLSAEMAEKIIAKCGAV